MATRKRTAAPGTEPDLCIACKGRGTVAKAVRVGRRQRVVGQQEGACLHCWGSGMEPEKEGEQ
jgi:DnaJ-class molecular chaperone